MTDLLTSAPVLSDDVLSFLRRHIPELEGKYFRSLYLELMGRERPVRIFGESYNPYVRENREELIERVEYDLMADGEEVMSDDFIHEIWRAFPLVKEINVSRVVLNLIACEIATMTIESEVKIPEGSSFSRNYELRQHPISEWPQGLPQFGEALPNKLDI